IFTYVDEKLLLYLHVEAGGFEGFDQLAGVEIAGDVEGVGLGLGGVALHTVDFFDRRFNSLAAGGATVVGASQGQTLDFSLRRVAVVLHGQVFVAGIAVETFGRQSIKRFLGGLVVWSSNGHGTLFLVAAGLDAINFLEGLGDCVDATLAAE